jgi:hypothetical protein
MARGNEGRDIYDGDRDRKLKGLRDQELMRMGPGI